MLRKVVVGCAIFALASNTLCADDIEADLSGFDSEEVTQVIAEDADLAGFDDEVASDSSDLDGFDEENVSDEPLLKAEIEESEAQEESRITIGGDLAFKTSLGYIKHEVNGIDYSGINQAQTSLYLELDAKLSDDWKLKVSGDMFYDAIYDIKSNTNYSDAILDAYRTQLRLDDTYIQGKITSDLDAKIGRQIVVWGKSDSIRVTDVINPLDNRTPAMTDIEDLRLSVGMAKFDYYLGSWNFSAMVIAESRILEEAPARGEFFPVDKIFSTAPNPFIELVEPSTSWDNTQYAFAANGVFSGWDLSFYGANVLDQKWHINPTTQLREVSKVEMLGSAINIATGSWLLKSEVAYLNGVKYNSTLDAKNRLDALVGFDYMGIRDTVLSLEVANRYIFDYESQMSQAVSKPDYVEKNEMQTAIRVTKSFLNDSLDATALLSIFGSSWENGGFARIWVDYELADAVGLNVGVVDYLDGDKPFSKAIRDNDRVFMDVTYSF